MAKLSARNAHEVDKISAQPADRSYRALYALRSDGKVLRRLASMRGGTRGGTGYIILGTASAEVVADMKTGPLTWDHVKVRAFLARVARRYRETVI